MNMTNMMFDVFVRLIVLFTAMPVHECAHGYIASRLGDNTARYQGRLTLNPFMHLDPLGSVLLLFTGFGWAKPVQVNPRNFKHPRRDMALSSLAGPVSNIILALIVMVVFKLCLGLGYTSAMRSGSNALYTILQMLSIMISVNLSLAVFNFLPIPPLDGSKIFGAILPEKYYFFMMQYERYVFIALFLLLYTGILSTPLRFLTGLLYSLLDIITMPVSWLVGII